MLAELIAAFRQETPALQQRIAHGMNCGDAAEVRAAAHTLKGTLGIFGPAPLIALAARIEELATAGDLTSVAALVGQLEGRLRELDREMEKFASPKCGASAVGGRPPLTPRLSAPRRVRWVCTG